jgi:hypothetical protein
VGIDRDLALLLTAVGSIISILFAFIWIAIRLGPKGRGQGNHGGNNDSLFDDELREHIRQKGIARFERTLDQNATFLQQDLHKVSDEVTEFIKDRASEILKDEFADQKQTIVAAQQHMSETFSQLDKSIQQYQKEFIEKFDKELTAEKQRRIERFQESMAQIISGHILASLGSQMEVSEQVGFIVDNLDKNKQAIVEDLKREL